MNVLPAVLGSSETTIRSENNGAFGRLCQLIDSRPEPFLLVRKEQIHLPNQHQKKPTNKATVLRTKVASVHKYPLLPATAVWL